MRYSRMVMFFIVLALGISNVAGAQEWVPYEGDVPENAMWTSPHARPAHPICRKNGRPNGWIGWMDEEKGICHTMGRSASDDNRPIRIVDWTADNQRRAYRSDRGGWTEYKPLRKAMSFEIMLAPDSGYAAWVPYTGQVPENALWTSPRKLAPHPICRMHKQGNGWIGWLDEEAGVCYTMGFNASNDRKRKIVSWTTDDTNKDGQGFEILVNAVHAPDDTSHAEGQGWYCRICDVSFETSEEMDAHAEEMGHTHHGDEHGEQGSDCGSFPMNSDGSVMVASPDGSERWLMSGEYTMNSDGSVTVNKEGEPDNGATVTPPPCNDGDHLDHHGDEHGEHHGGWHCAICDIDFDSAEEMDAHAEEAGHVSEDEVGEQEELAPEEELAEEQETVDENDTGNQEAYVFIGCNYWGHGRTGANGVQNVTWDVCHDAALNGDYEWFGLNWGDHVEEGKGGCHVSNAQLPKVLQGTQCEQVTDEEGHFLGRNQSMAVYRKQN